MNNSINAAAAAAREHARNTDGTFGKQHHSTPTPFGNNDAIAQHLLELHEQSLSSFHQALSEFEAQRDYQDRLSASLSLVDAQQQDERVAWVEHRIEFEGIDPYVSSAAFDRDGRLLEDVEADIDMTASDIQRYARSGITLSCADGQISIRDVDSTQPEDGACSSWPIASPGEGLR